MKVKYIYSACLEISTPDGIILTDPWFTDGVYDGSWYQFPKVDPFEHISEPDYIYISHIHPDHYDPKFLHKLFEKFGSKPILIPDLKNNYLLFKGKSDGLSLTPTRNLDLGDTEIFIEENNTGSISDVDSALIIQDKVNGKSFLNLNDCIFNQPHVEKLLSITNDFTKKIDLLALGYAGAGPFPQTYFDLNSDREILIEKASQKKRDFFDRYVRFTSSFPSTYHLPFAGEYILGGKLAELNDFRGVADAFEVTKFDPKALVFNPGGYINLSSTKIVNIRSEKFHTSSIKERVQEIQAEKLDYELDFNLDFHKINFPRLLKKANLNALRKSEINEQYYFIFSVTENDQIVKKYSCNCIDGEITELDLNEQINLDCYSEIIIDFRYLFGLLTTVYHWNNADIGSLYNTRRYPADNFKESVQRYLNFFSIA